MEQALITHLSSLYTGSPASVITRREHLALVKWIATQSRTIAAPVVFTSDEISPSVFLRTYERTGSLIISTAHISHPCLTAGQNAWFRAVHDWHHLCQGADFDMFGEISAFLFARATAPREIWWILFSEIVLQAAATLHHGTFQAQKLVRV